MMKLIDRIKDISIEAKLSTAAAGADFCRQVNDFNMTYNTGGLDLFENSTNMLPPIVAEAVLVGTAVYFGAKYIKSLFRE